MQKQMPYSFSYLRHSSVERLPNDAYAHGPVQRYTGCVMVTIESTRSKKQSVRARGSWDDDPHTLIEVPALPEESYSNLEGMSMAHCNYFWDWMHYGAVLAICQIYLEDYIEYGPMDDFLQDLPLPAFSPIRNDPEYFKKLTQFAHPIGFRFEDNGF